MSLNTAFQNTEHLVHVALKVAQLDGTPIYHSAAAALEGEII